MAHSPTLSSGSSAGPDPNLALVLGSGSSEVERRSAQGPKMGSESALGVKEGEAIGIGGNGLMVGLVQEEEKRDRGAQLESPRKRTKTLGGVGGKGALEAVGEVEGLLQEVGAWRLKWQVAQEGA